ncbi:MAG: hypothetical protein ACLGJB_26115 [Blastocatellia bacterium]
MSEYNSKSDWFSTPGVITSIDRAAQLAWNAIAAGRIEVNVAVEFPNKQALSITIHVLARVDSTAVITGERSTALAYKTLFEFQHLPQPCLDCRSRASRSAVLIKSARSLSASIIQTAKFVYEHGCLDTRQAQTVDRDAGRGRGLDRGAPIRIYGPSARVKLLNAAEAAHKGRATVAKKARNPIKVMNPPGKQEAPKALPAPTSEGVQGFLEGSRSAPSICYTLPATANVEVTVPYYICHTLIDECSKSNHHGREVGGVLIGHRYEQRPGQSSLKEYKTLVTDILPIESADSSSAHIRLDEEAWVNVLRELDVKYEQQNKVQLGWYHTHPTQGIFFSPYDIDAHTIFRQPFQFAFVVDPRTMEAGLFYWGDYGKRSLAGPIKFSLKCEREDVAPPPAIRSYRKPVSLLRALLSGVFGAAIVSLAWSAFGNDKGFISPDQACLIALIVLAWLRLWNANVFHPADPLEALLAARAGRYIGRNLQDRINRVSGHLLDLKLPVAFGLIVAAVTAFTTYYIVSYRNEKEARATPPAAGGESWSDSNSREDTNMNARRILFSESQQQSASKRVVLQFGNTGVKVEYLISGQSVSDLHVVDKIKEVDFFRTVFGLSIEVTPQGSDDVKSFQQVLDLGESADGKWGNDTRNAFLRKARWYKITKEAMRVPLSSNQFIDVMFD